jgi:hypothetical protein
VTTAPASRGLADPILGPTTREKSRWVAPFTGGAIHPPPSPIHRADLGIAVVNLLCREGGEVHATCGCHPARSCAYLHAWSARVKRIETRKKKETSHVRTNAKTFVQSRMAWTDRCEHAETTTSMAFKGFGASIAVCSICFAIVFLATRNRGRSAG